jgi:TolA-binding protein
MANPPFPSVNSPANWYTLPSYNSAIMDPNNGTLGIPWNNLMVFISTRAAFLTQMQAQVTALQTAVTTLQGQVATLQGQVTTLQGDVTTLQGQVATLQSQVATLQADVATIQGQITALQAEDVHLQNEIDTINAIFAVHTVATLPSPAAGLKSNVSDALTPAFGVAVVGGGAVFTPVYSDGSGWFVG